MNAMRRFPAALLLYVLAALPLAAQTGLKPKGFANDFAGALPAAAVSSLEEQCREIERKTGAEVAVAVVKDLGGRDVEGYANDLFKSWGIGKKGRNNGVLVLISMAEHKIRIEVGYGLEGVLSDGACGGIIRNVMTPKFRANDYAGGLSQAVAAIGRIVGGESAGRVVPRDPIDWFVVGFTVIWDAFCLLFSFVIWGLIGVIASAAVTAILAVLCASTGPVPTFLKNNLVLGPFIIGPFGMIFLLGPLRAILESLHVIPERRTPGLWTGAASGGDGGSWSGGGFSGGGDSGGGGFGGGDSGGGGASGSW